ncbi:hypothetical protein [Pseudomonas orientalis]|uniref:hypothetical protein n=1 Tax=Pseudomonas orientalis TaxID=76758 RepID=UPI0030D9F142
MSALDPELFNSLESPESPESSEGLESLEGLQGMGTGLKFPLDNDYPILVKKDESTGQDQVLVTYSQDRWDFSSVSGTIKNFYFYRVSNSAKGNISASGWKAFKMVMAYLWINRGHSISIETYGYYYKQFRALFVIMTSHNVDVLEAPMNEDQAYKVFGLHRRASVMLQLIAVLYVGRSRLGFYFLAPWESTLVQRMLEPVESQQTPCIPWRIWEYQKDRLKEFMDDFISSSERLGRLQNRLIDLYEGSDYNRKRVKGRVTSDTHNIKPFGKENHRYLTFHHYSTFYGLSPLLRKWMVPFGRDLDTIVSQDGARIFSSYLTAVSYVGLLYLGNYSGMRRGELSKLRANCFISDDDEVLGKAYFLCGGTSKTINDPNALWVTDEYSGEVVKALGAVSAMRLRCAKIFNRGDVVGADMLNPLLLLRAYEPWGRARGEALDKSVELCKDFSYNGWQGVCPNLFDTRVLTITEEDFLLAKKYTPSLDIQEFAVGNIWPFALHQLRRTLLIDATESGVSRSSTQYQAKHRDTSMTRYYISNFQSNLSAEMRKGLMAEIVASLSRTAVGLKENHFVSVYGQEHKAKLIEFVDLTDIKDLCETADTRSFSIRETFFGICLKKGYCSSGGITFVGDCGTCAEGLGDKRKVAVLVALKDDLTSRLVDFKSGDLDYISMEFQIKAIDAALKTLRSDDNG